MSLSPNQRHNSPTYSFSDYKLYRSIAVLVLDLKTSLELRLDQIKELVTRDLHITETQLEQAAHCKPPDAVALGFYLLPDELLRGLNKLRNCRRSSYFVLNSEYTESLKSRDPKADLIAQKIKRELLEPCRDLLNRSTEGARLAEVLEARDLGLGEVVKFSDLVNYSNLQLGIEDLLAVLTTLWRQPLREFLLLDRRSISGRFANELLQTKATEQPRVAAHVLASAPKQPPPPKPDYLDSAAITQLEDEINFLPLDFSEARRYAVRLCWLKRQLRAHSKSDSVFELEKNLGLKPGKLHRILEIGSGNKLHNLTMEEIKSLTQSRHISPKIGKYFISRTIRRAFLTFCETKLKQPLNPEQEETVERTIDRYMREDLKYRPTVKLHRIFSYSEIPEAMQNFALPGDLSISLARHWGVAVTLKMFGRTQVTTSKHGYSEALQHSLTLHGAAELSLDEVPVEKLFFISSRGQARKEIFDLLVLRHQRVLYLENLSKAWNQAIAFTLAEKELAHAGSTVFKLLTTCTEDLPIWTLNAQDKTILVNTYKVREAAADFLGKEVSALEAKMLVLQLIGGSPSAHEEFKNLLENRFGIAVPIETLRPQDLTFEVLEQQIAALVRLHLETRGLRFASAPIKT